MDLYSQVKLQSISVLLCCVNVLWGLGFSSHTFIFLTDLKVIAERDDFSESQQKLCAVSPRRLVSSVSLLSALPVSSWPPVDPPGVGF